MRLDRARDRARFAARDRAVFRIESARLIAGLMRLVRDADLATKAELRAAESTEVIAAMKTWRWGPAVLKTFDRTRRPRDRNRVSSRSQTPLSGHRDA